MRRFLLAAACAAAFPASALAQAETTGSGELVIADERIVDELVITRLPMEPQDTPDATVITRQDIDLRQSAFAADVLQLAPGITLARNGAYGGITSVLMRGASSDKTLILVDGIIQNDASQPAGGFDISNLQLDDIEKVEILNGPQAALWGSDAIGGVIAFTSREENGLRAEAEGGTYSTARGSVGAGHVGDNWAVSASASGFRTDGISKADGFPERDGFWNWTVSGAGRLQAAAWLTLDGRVTYDRSRADVDGYAPPFFAFGDTADWSASRSWSAFARAVADGPWGLKQTFLLSAYDLNRSSSGIEFTAQRRDYRWMAERGDARDTVSFAVGAERDDTEANLSTGDKASLGTTSAFVLGRWRPLAPLTLSASLRYDDPDAFAGRATGKVGGVLTLGAGFALTADWGQGFKTPTISETACDFCFPAGPSVGLKPESADGWDVGLRWRSEDGRFSAQVTGFRLSVTDQISYGIGRYVNLNHTRASGVEASGTARLTDWLWIKGSYTHTDSEDLATHLALIRVTPDVGSASLFWRSDRLSGAVTLRAESARLDTDPSTFSPAQRPGFVVADVAGAWKLNDRIELTGRIENLAGAHYQQSLGYGEPGRVLMVGVRLRSN